MKRSDYDSQKYSVDYYKKNIVNYNKSCKKYYLKKLGCNMIEKPFFSIEYFPHGVNPFESDLKNQKRNHR